jgi:hypothetical protein
MINKRKQKIFSCPMLILSGLLLPTPYYMFEKCRRGGAARCLAAAEENGII